MLKRNYILIAIFIAACLTCCSKMKSALALQDDYAEDFKPSEQKEPFILPRMLRPSVRRGTTEYSALLPEGKYLPIGSSKGRIFFQAPEGFRCTKSAQILSAVGGIVQITKGDYTKYYVWYFLEAHDYLELDPEGEWHNSIKPGAVNLAGRPWIEGDLKIAINPD